MKTPLRRLLVGGTAVAVVAPAAAAVPAMAAAPARVTLARSAPAWAQPRRDEGAAPEAQHVTVHVHLRLRDAAGAETLAAGLTDPASATYGQYLSPADFRARFAPGDADVAAVSDFLRGAGLTVGDVPANHLDVPATGTLAQVEQAFGVDVHRYAYRGKLLNAPTDDLTIPAALSDEIVAVSGVDQSGLLNHPNAKPPVDEATLQQPAPDAPVTAPEKHSDAAVQATPGAPPPDAFVNAPPCSRWYGARTAWLLPPAFGAKQPYAPCGYDPAQLRGAYGMNPRGIDGSGVTVAITDAYASPTIEADANQYAQRHGQRPFAPGQLTQRLPDSYRYGYDDQANGDLCGEQGWYGEETLDVEAVHAIAPGANVLYVASQSCDDPDFLTVLNDIVDHHRADIVTNSWGDAGEDDPLGLQPAYHQVFLQAALEGIGVFFSSGDSGDESDPGDLGTPSADYPASDSYVTAVGGTSLGVGFFNNYKFESGWVTGKSALSGWRWDPAPPGAYLYGGGGGVSSVFAQPVYQQGVVPSAIAKGKRVVPDVAMVGDPNTGMLVGETQTFPDGSVRYSEYRLGGTSLSSPLMAAVSALADQQAGHAHGFINPALYRLVGSGALHDVVPRAPSGVVRVDYANGVDASDGTATSLRSIGAELQSLHTAAGYDTLTGVGTPNGGAYLSALGR